MYCCLHGGSLPPLFSIRKEQKKSFVHVYHPIQPVSCMYDTRLAVIHLTYFFIRPADRNVHMQPRHFSLSRFFRSVDTVMVTARFTHDIIALVAFGVDVSSITATPERPCHSFDAIEVATTAFVQLIRNPITK